MKRRRYSEPLNYHVLIFSAYTGMLSVVGGLVFAAFVATPLTPSETWLAVSGLLAAAAIAGWHWFWWRRARQSR